MATYRLKRKTFADEQDGQKSGMSTGKKIALGIGGTALAAGGLFYGARKGMLGARTMQSANKAWGNLGSKAYKNGFKGIGESMMTSAGADLEKGLIKGKVNALGKDATKEMINTATQRGSKVAQNIQNTWMKNAGM